MYAFFVRKYGNKRYRKIATSAIACITVPLVNSSALACSMSS